MYLYPGVASPPPTTRLYDGKVSEDAILVFGEHFRRYSILLLFRGGREVDNQPLLLLNYRYSRDNACISARARLVFARIRSLRGLDALCAPYRFANELR